MSKEAEMEVTEKCPDADELAERVRNLFAGGNVAGGITGPLSNGVRYFILPQSNVEADHARLSEVRTALAARQAELAAVVAERDALAELLDMALDEYETTNGKTKSLPHWSYTARNVLEHRQALAQGSQP